MVVQRRWRGPSIVGLTLTRRLPLGPAAAAAAAARSVTTLVLTHTNGVDAASGVTQIYPETSEAPKGVELQLGVLCIVSEERPQHTWRPAGWHNLQGILTS